MASGGSRPLGVAGGGLGKGWMGRKVWIMGFIGLMMLLGLMWVVWFGEEEGVEEGLGVGGKGNVTVRLDRVGLVLGFERGVWEVEEVVINEGDRSVNVEEGLVEGLWKGVGGRNIEKLVAVAGRRGGVPKRWLDAFVGSAMERLVTLGLIPVFEVEVVVGGVKDMSVERDGGVGSCEAVGGLGSCRWGDLGGSRLVRLGRMEYYYGEKLEDVMSGFCERHGVKGKQAKEVWNVVEKEARRRGVIPELEVALDLMDKEKQEDFIETMKWEMYQGENVIENLKRFTTSSNDTEQVPRAIVARHLALRRIVPLLIMTVPQVMELGSKPRSPLSQEVMKYERKYVGQIGVSDHQPGNLTLFAGDDFPSHITSFLDVHRLTYGSRPKLIARAHHAAVLNGVEPVASFRVDIGQYDPSRAGSKALMPLYLGRGILESVEEFCQIHKLQNNTKQSLFLDVKKLFGAIPEHVDAVLELAYHNGKDNVYPINVPIKEGGNIEEVVSGRMSSVKMAEKNVPWLTDGIAREATKAKALPALTFRVDVPQGWAPLNVHVEQNMSRVVGELLEDLGVKERHSTVFCKVARSAIARQLIPAASAEVQVSINGWKEPKLMYIDLHDGDDAITAVQAMEGRNQLSQSQKDYLARDLQKRLDDEFSKVPEETVLMNLGGLNVSLPIFQGEPWQEAIERAKQYPVWGDPLTQREMDLLEQQAREIFVELGIAPALEFNISMKERGSLSFPLYIDETIPEAVDRFAGIHNLTKRQMLKVTKLVQHKAVASRIFPAFAVNVTVQGGKAPLRFYHGQSINTTIKEFGRVHGFSKKRIERLIRDVIFRAKRARVVPLFVTNYTVNGVSRRVALYHGDKIGVVASRVANKHGLDVQGLHKTLMSRARELRVVPVWSVPIKVMSGGSEAKVFVDIYQGDDIGLVAKGFISSRGLGIDPGLMANIVRSQIAVGGEDSKGIT